MDRKELIVKVKKYFHDLGFDVIRVEEDENAYYLFVDEISKLGMYALPKNLIEHWEAILTMAVFVSQASLLMPLKLRLKLRGMNFDMFVKGVAEFMENFPGKQVKENE